MTRSATHDGDPRKTYDDWAKVYDLADADKTPYFEFYTALLTPNARSVLELGCGTGTVIGHLLAKARANGQALRATGVDLSEPMLSVAQGRQPGIDWVLGDMRAPPLAGPYDLVFSCYNSLQSLATAADLEQTFQAVRRLLNPSALFAFDIYQPNIPYLEEPARDRMTRAIVAPDGRRLEIREDTWFDRASQILVVDWGLIELAEDGARTQLATVRHALRQFDAATVNRALAAADLVVKERYGDLDRLPFTPTSKKQVLVCQPASDSN